MNNFFPLYYFGPIGYFNKIIQHTSIAIQVTENYTKQTYRNRCSILSSNGLQHLIIPISKPKSGKNQLADITINYTENWQKQHWRSLETCYKNSPYFIYYQDYLVNLYSQKTTYLIDFNLKTIEIIFQLLGYTCAINVIKNTFNSTADYLNNENMFHLNGNKTYQQVFTSKTNFVNNLSILDLLFNEGPKSLLYLKS